MLIPFDQLFARHKIKCPGVLHLGANTGQEASAYNTHGARRVVWVEAVPSVHAQLTRHVTAYPGHVALLACVSDKDGERATFNIASNQAQSSSLLEFGTHEKEHPTVRFVAKMEMITTRVDTLLTTKGIAVGPGWFLNIDLQGAELLALRGMGALLNQFDHAYIEVNEKELYKGCPFTRDIDDYLYQYGFTGKETKMTGSGWGDKLYSRV